MASVAELDKISKQLKRDSLRMTHAAKSGHPGGSLGCANFFASLFFEVMEQKPDFDMNGIGEDIFILSNGHISPVYYSTLARQGYIELSELSTFRKLNSRLQVLLWWYRQPNVSRSRLTKMNVSVPGATRHPVGVTDLWVSPSLRPMLRRCP